MKPDPNDWPVRVRGLVPGRTPCIRSRIGSLGNVTDCVVEMLTTAGCNCSTRSANDCGAPARGAADTIRVSSFCATCAPAGDIRVMAVPLNRRAAVVA